VTKKLRKRDLDKEMKVSDLKHSWRKMEATVKYRAGWRRVEAVYKLHCK